MINFRVISRKMPSARVESVSRLLYRNIGHTHKSLPMVKRNRTVITTETVDFKTAHSAKTKQAWRYQGGQILRAVSTRINNKEYEDPKDPGQPRRKQESNFFLTINPNKTPKDDSPEHLPAAVTAMERMLQQISQDSVLATYIKFGPKVLGTPPAAQDYRLDRYADVVHSVDWKAAVESGDVLRRLHTHIWLTITHYSQVQINIQMLQHIAREEYNKALPLGNAFDYLRIKDMPYVHVKLLPQSDWTDVMRQYIHKGMTAE